MVEKLSTEPRAPLPRAEKLVRSAAAAAAAAAPFYSTMGAANSSEPANEVWPPDWEEMPEEKRRLARAAILSLSALPPDEFLAIGSAAHAIPRESWKFGEYHAAAAAAVQEDIKLNKIVYKLVPKKTDESDFWRLYFSEVLYVLDSVKTHGQYPPPPPPEPEKPKKAPRKKPPPPPDDSSCVVS